MDLKIRPAMIDDYEALCHLFDEGDALHREYLPHLFQESPGPVREAAYVRELIDDDKVGFFVATRADKPVGALVVLARETPEVPIFVPRRYAIVDNVVVAEKQRNRGIGRALMRRAEAWAKERELLDVELNVYAFNQNAIGFYRELGYEIVRCTMSKRLVQ